MNLVEAILKRLITAAIEDFPIDRERKAIILQKIMKGISNEEE